MKPGRSSVLTGVWPAASHQAHAASKRRRAGVEAGRDLDQLHQLRRQAEMHADHPVLATAARRDLGDRQRRGVGGEDGFFRTDPVQRPEQLLLGPEVLEHRLDHQIAGPEIAELGRLDEAADDPVELFPAELAALDRFREKSFGLAARALQRCGLDVVGDCGKTGAGGDDRDPGAHGAAGAGDADRLDRTAHLRTKLRPISWRWIWLVPSQIWVILASRISRSARWSLQ